jgi:membrane protease YdiL (CAAX protease family)
MTFDDHNPTGTAPARVRSNEVPESLQDPVPDAMHDRASGDAPHPAAEQTAGNTSGPPTTDWQAPVAQTPNSKLPAAIPEDLHVPWGWREIVLFLILGVIGSIVVYQGLAEVTVRFFGVPRSQLFGDTMSTAKSVILLASQAILDSGAILYLYLMLLARTPEPFWQSIGWREMRPGTGTIRHSAFQFLAGGAVLALAVNFVASFLNSKETLPIEELLKARVSVFLFTLGAVVVAPLVEETVFRGFLYPVIARRLGIAAGIGITGVLFGLMHAAQLWGGWGQIALLVMVGVTLTWVRARTGTVAASYFVHLGYNGLQLVGYVVYLIGGLKH